MSCPDCKGSGKYQPLIGLAEPCQTCVQPTEELHGIYVPRGSGTFYWQEKPLAEILEINVLSYHPLALQFDGSRVTEFTDTESPQFKDIIRTKPSHSWCGFQYLVEHHVIGKAKFNYKPYPIACFHFQGMCIVTLKTQTIGSSTGGPPITWHQKIMRQL